MLDGTFWGFVGIGTGAFISGLLGMYPNLFLDLTIGGATLVVMGFARLAYQKLQARPKEAVTPSKPRKQHKLHYLNPTQNSILEAQVKGNIAEAFDEV